MNDFQRKLFERAVKILDIQKGIRRECNWLLAEGKGFGMLAELVIMPELPAINPSAYAYWDERSATIIPMGIQANAWVN